MNDEEGLIVLNETAIKSKLDYKLQLEIASKIEGTLKKLTITNAENLSIATSTVATAETFVKKIEDTIDELLAPYQEQIKSIKEYGKEIVQGIEAQTINVRRDITLYKTTSIASATVTYNKQMEENEKKAESIRENFQTVNRVAKQLISRIFGGSFVNGKGVSIPIASPTIISEVDYQLDFIQKNAPISGTTIEPFESVAESIKKTIITSGSLLKDYIGQKMNSTDSFQIAGIDKQISLLRANTEIKIEEDLKGGEKYISAHLKTLNKEANNGLKAVSKGTRKNLIYCVDDIKVVPTEYLTIDEKAINQFKKDNKEQLEKGIQLIPGITFSVTSTAVISK